MNKVASVFSLVMFLSMGLHTVQAQTIAIDFVPNNFSMSVGQVRTVNVSGASVYYLNGNTNPGVASAVLSGSFVTINALSAGTDRVSICAYGANNAVSCGAVNFTVAANPSAQTTVQQPANATISFERSQVSLNVGETQTVRVTGSAAATGAGSYYVSDANSNAASVSISSNILTVVGNEVGGENITVCQIGGACGNIYVYVPSTQANIQASQTVRKTNPGLSALYIASNGASFLSPNSTLTIKFDTTADITSSVLRISSRSVQVNGTSSGPYSASYALNGSETYPLPVSIDFWAADGTAGHTSFTINDSGMPQAAASAAGSAGSAAGSSAGVRFARALSSGSTGSDVSALQAILKKLGFFNGPVTGNYGPLTAAGVKRYQAAHGLDQLGTVGPGTRAALNKE